MINFFKILSYKKVLKLDDCISHHINDDEADVLFGGFKEYVPPIYEQEDIASKQHTKISDLLSGIHSLLK